VTSPGTADSVSATAIVDAPAEAVFAVLADPTTHAAIDGTGWVCAPLDPEPVTAVGQVFRMAMYHPDHPDGDYRMANRVDVFEPPHAIAWVPLHYADDGLRSGGWYWRYDLVPVGDATEVTLTYDWSAATEVVRARIGFPPFGPDHLPRSRAHLAVLATRPALP
jgi:uncharacterized protein YndB with AHSA1/START domain